jgi:hypothetical protein
MEEYVFGDMSDEFVFDDQDMDYLDGPISGWVQRKRDGAWFAFVCQRIIADLLWHWTLVPVIEKGPDHVAALLNAAATKSGMWLSITEDRRSTKTSVSRLVAIESKAAAPVLGHLKPKRHATTT